MRALLAALFIVVFGLGMPALDDSGSAQARISLPGGDVIVTDGNIASI